MTTVHVLSPQATLALLETPGIGRQSVLGAMPYIQGDSHEEILAGFQNAARAGAVRRIPSAGDLSAGAERAEDTLREAISNGITILGWADRRFPVRLKLIPDPPLLLYAKGNIRRLSHPFSVAVIGTRDPSDAGAELAFALGRCVSEANVAVVSGLALGCDIEAHRGALEGPGSTIAVLAHGLDTVYPAAHRPDARRILETGGTLVSEYPPGSKPIGPHFVERDRIQAGLSDWVIIVETDVKGGTMHTAGFATTQGRKLFAYRHGPLLRNHPKAQGNAHLISTGRATPLESASAISQLLFGLVPPERVEGRRTATESSDRPPLTEPPTTLPAPSGETQPRKTSKKGPKKAKKSKRLRTSDRERGLGAFGDVDVEKVRGGDT